MGCALAALAAPAAADTFGGFSGIDARYQVNQDRLCIPLDATGGTATGTPTCMKAAADEIANASVNPPVIAGGVFTASASGYTLTVANQSGGAVVTWTAPDPIGGVIEVYASGYADRIAVAYKTRSFGKDVTQVVAFLLVKTSGRSQPIAPSTTGPATAQPATAAAPVDPKVAKAVTSARAATAAKALAAWQQVLALDADHAEAQYRIASLRAARKQTADGIAALQTLAKSTRADAVEWLVEARFDPAFAAVRADPTYRATVGLDRPPSGAYERLMGLGGTWLQNGTQCETGEVRLTFKQARTFELRFRSSCSGHTSDEYFHGTWQLDGTSIKLALPLRGQAATAKDESVCEFQTADTEDALRCALGKDLDFVVLPVRQ